MIIIYSKQICLVNHLPIECFQVALKGTHLYMFLFVKFLMLHPAQL